MSTTSKRRKSSSTPSSGDIALCAIKNQLKLPIREAQVAAPKSSHSSVQIAIMKTLSVSIAEVAGFERLAISVELLDLLLKAFNISVAIGLFAVLLIIVLMVGFCFIEWLFWENFCHHLVSLYL